MLFARLKTHKITKQRSECQLKMMQAQKLTIRLLSGKQEPIAKQIWGSEDEAEIARKQKQWALARQKQNDDRNRVFSLKDVAKVALITFISREILHRLGISV